MKEYKEYLLSIGKNPDDFIVTENGYYPKRNLDIRKVAKEEDNTVKGEVALNLSISNLEMLQLSQTTKEQLGTDQAMANLESLMLVSELQGKIAALETEIAELKGVE